MVVLAGPGNNGGDGFVAARLLAARGRDVIVGVANERRALRGDAGQMAALWSGRTEKLTPDLLDGAALVVDALFGAGLSRPIERQGDIAQVFDQIKSRGLPVMAVDVPSGLEGDTGAVHGAVLPASATVTFFRPKPGHLLMPGRELCGRLIVADIGIPASVLDAERAPGPLTWTNHPPLFFECLPDVAVAGHKYDRGHTVVISGSIEMSGAARLAAGAALRVGAGLVTVAASGVALNAHATHLNAILLANVEGADDVRDMLKDKRKNAVVIGPGLGQHAGARDAVMAVLESDAAVVLDADAINVAAKARDELFSAIAAKPGRPVVLTPHAGEFSRLFPEIDGSKLEKARKAAALSHATLVLKGPDTVIAAADGRAAINVNAPPWLATAGSGDVLAGITGGLLATNMPAFEAAAGAVWMHGAAAERFGRGLVAEDLAGLLPAVMQDLWSR